MTSIAKSGTFSQRHPHAQADGGSSCDHLLRRISELYEKVDPIALDIVRSWQTGYVAWKYEKMHTRAGPDNAPYSAIWAQKHLNTAPTTTLASGCQIGRV